MQVGVDFTNDDRDLEGTVACIIENMSFRTDFAPGTVCPRESKAMAQYYCIHPAGRIVAFKDSF